MLPKLLAVLAFVAPLIQCFENPSLEVVVVIKASTNSVSQEYFTSTIVPFLIQLPLVFPSEVSQDKPDYVRVTVNVGSENNTWPLVQLQNQTRSEYVATVRSLKPNGSDNEIDGNQKALSSALETYYKSSVALNRITLLLTDKVEYADGKSSLANDLRQVTDQLFVIGISSKNNPTFYDSVQAASSLTGESDYVYSSIELASSNGNGVGTYIQKLLKSPLRPCEGVIFLNEATAFVDTQTQLNFAAMQDRIILETPSNVAVSTQMFYDLLVDNFVFTHSPKVPQIKLADRAHDDEVYTNQASVYQKLVEINNRERLPYLAIVIMSQADNVTKTMEITAAMSELAKHDNIDVFVFDVSENGNLGRSFFSKVTSTDKIVNLYRGHTIEMYAQYQNLVAPHLLEHKCY